MVNLTLAVPDALKHRMDAFPEINWSEVARQAFSRKIKDLEFLEEMSQSSTLTEKDTVALGRKVNRNLAKRYFRKKKA